MPSLPSLAVLTISVSFTTTEGMFDKLKLIETVARYSMIATRGDKSQTANNFECCVSKTFKTSISSISLSFNLRVRVMGDWTFCHVLILGCYTVKNGVLINGKKGFKAFRSQKRF